VALRLENELGQFVELDADNYEFPMTKGSHWDDNWLFITLSASDGTKRWSSRDPALTTFELRDLGEWLRSLASSKAGESIWGATEPNLSFAAMVDDDSIQLRVELDLEFNRDRHAYAGDPAVLEFRLDRRHGAELAAQVEEIAGRFPDRT
jgi:hypothetical protein